MKLKPETVKWLREMWTMIIVGVSEAGLLLIAVPRLDWNELGRIIAVTAVAKFFYFMKQSPLPRQRSVRVTMSGPNANVTIERPSRQPESPAEENRKQA